MHVKHKEKISLTDLESNTWDAIMKRARMLQVIPETGKGRRQAIKEAAETLGLSESQIYRLLKKFRSRRTTSSLLPCPPGPEQGSRRLSPAMEKIISSTIKKHYYKREKVSTSHLLRCIDQACRAQNIIPPSRSTVNRRLLQEDVWKMTVAREGYKSARQKLKPVKIGLRPEHPLDVVQMDHTRADIIVVQEHTGVTLGRPWITLCLDVCTRMVLGFTIGFDPPSATVVALTLTQTVLPKSQWTDRHDISLMWPAHGLPRILHTDNAKEFHSRALRRGCEEHGIQIAFRPRGSPHFGGHIERLMGTLMRRLHALPGTTFSSVAQRGDYPSEKRAILTLEALRRHIALKLLLP